MTKGASKPSTQILRTVRSLLLVIISPLRLRKELSGEVEIHERELEELRSPVHMEQDEKPSSPPGDYSTRVEEAQLQVCMCL